MTAAAPFMHGPAVEGDFHLPAAFALEAGGVLRDGCLRYAVYGKINEARDNVVLVCHALSGSARVGDWWPAIFQSDSLIHPERDAVIGINILGSCYGSTGPASIDLSTGRPYGARFPLVQIADMVRAQVLLLDSLGVTRLRKAVGASLGGMQVMEWALQFPSKVAEILAIGAAPLNAFGLALNHLQRQAIYLDPAWCHGDYATDAPPRSGLGLARALAVCSYKSTALLEERFHRQPDRSGENPVLDAPGMPGRFDVAGYLDHQATTFVQRFDANSYLALTRSMDLFDPAAKARDASVLWKSIQARVLLIGISSDILFPPADIEAMAEAMKQAGVHCTYKLLVSSHGHDAFLAEPATLIDLLRHASS